MSSVVIAGDTSGSVTLQAPAVSGTTVLTLPATSGTVLTTASGTAATATNLAGGSNGTIPYQSASGTTQMLAVGTSGQVLQTNGAGAPTWVTASGSGLVCLAVASASASATVDFTSSIDSTYDQYIFEFQNVIPATTGTQLYLRMSTDSGASFIATSYQIANINNASNASTPDGFTTSASANQIRLDVGGISNNAIYGGISGSLSLFAPSSTASYKKVKYSNTSSDGVGYFNIVGTGVQPTTSAVNAVRFLMSSGNITSGLFKMYGVRKSV